MWFTPSAKFGLRPHLATLPSAGQRLVLRADPDRTQRHLFRARFTPSNRAEITCGANPAAATPEIPVLIRQQRE